MTSSRSTPAAGRGDLGPEGVGRLDAESCYRAVKSRDRRFDGVFYTAVRTTGIYCRPSCPARTPAFGNVTFHPTAAAAQAAGFRACKRCLPDATPGSPDWDVAADVAGRAMRLISDGLVDREGVEGLASHVGYTTRHLTRLLTGRLGAGPLALARARRAQTARILIETTDLGFADVAFAAGFTSVRQFNETVREVYDASPTQLRGRRGAVAVDAGTLELRLAVRTPYAGSALLSFLAARAVPGVEIADPAAATYARTLTLPHGPGSVRLTLTDHAEGRGTAFVPASFRLADLRDTAAAVERVRRLLDADGDPLAVADSFAGDPVLGRLVRSRPGLRVPGHVDGPEIAVRAVLGQQVSVPAARTLASRLVSDHGVPVDSGVEGLTRLFPTPEALAGVDPESLPMPRARGRALVGLAGGLADGRVALDRGACRADVRSALLGLSGIGPWTADYVAMRALGDPDVLLPTDLGTREALRAAGVDPASAAALAERWRPWRSYAQVHLWHSLADEGTPRA
jgi:AraC family transcriptional regulator, regulatory protein of adaptative response / DNA-3-methyladenine glycosylase II